MTNPLVSVICLCYNHERFVEEAIRSVFEQTYPNIEVIVVDDASTDNSLALINTILKGHSSARLLALPANVGNCRAFNAGWRMANGRYIVDFATDDVFERDRIEKQVRYFESEGKDHGVVFTDAIYIDEQGGEVRRHFGYLRRKGLLQSIPQGDVYADVIERFFIPAPTMLVRSEVLRALGGYDEELAYEDFDFWVRSSRDFSYGLIEEPLTRIRVSSASLSRRIYTVGDKQVYSTYLVCKKIAKLNRTEREKVALRRRVQYELRHCVLTGYRKEAALFYQLLNETGAPDFLSRLLFAVSKTGVTLAPVRRLYHWLRYS